MTALALSFMLVALMPTGAVAQQSAPPLPADVTLVYYKDAQDKLVALAFESNMTSLNPFVFAARDKVGYAELKGAQAAIVLADRQPRFCVFVADKMDPPPHQLVRLTRKKRTRRFTVVRVKGRKGYSPMQAESVSLDYRLLERLRVDAGRGRAMFLNYMEIRPRIQLTPGEYAIIGDSLLDIATFRID